MSTQQDAPERNYGSGAFDARASMDVPTIGEHIELGVN